MSRFRMQSITVWLIILSFSTPLLGQELTKAITIKQLPRLPTGLTEATVLKDEIEPPARPDKQ